jgi:hypothetical protein
MVRMRTARRFSHYMAGELIAVPFDAAQELAAKRLATPLDLLIPTPVAVPDDAAPLRAPGGIVRK